MKALQPLYRPMLLKAWKTAWYHRELWLLAALASLAGTGTVLNDILSQANNALAFPQNGGGAFGFISFLSIYFDHLVAATPVNAIVSFSVLALLTLGAVTLIIGAQHTLLRTLHRAASGRARVPASTLLQETKHPRIVRMLVINVFCKLLIVNTLLFGIMILRGLNTSTVLMDAFFGFVFSFALVGIIFFLNVFCVYSLIAASKDDVGIVESMRKAWDMLAAHPTVSIEMSAILFGLNFLFTAAYVGGLVLIAVPFLFLFTVAVGSGSLGAVSAVSLALVLLLITGTVTAAGFITTFTWSAWTELVYTLARRKMPVKPRLQAHLARLHMHLS